MSSPLPLPSPHLLSFSLPPSLGARDRNRADPESRLFFFFLLATVEGTQRVPGKVKLRRAGEDWRFRCSGAMRATTELHRCRMGRSQSLRMGSTLSPRSQCCRQGSPSPERDDAPPPPNFFCFVFFREKEKTGLAGVVPRV